MIWAGIGACVFFYVVCIVINLVSCVPVSRILQTSDSVGRSPCGQTQLNISVAQGLFNSISDLYVLTIPISLVVKLHLPLKRKVGVSAIFLTGLL